MSKMFQQALWIGGTDQEDQGQEVDLLKSMIGAGLERSSAPNHRRPREQLYLVDTSDEDARFAKPGEAIGCKHREISTEARNRTKSRRAKSVAMKAADHFTPKSDRMGKAWSANLPGRTLSSLAKRINRPSDGSLRPLSK